MRKQNRREKASTIYMQLEMRLESLAAEMAEVTEGRDRLRKRGKFFELVEEIYQGKKKKGEAGVAGAELEKLSNFWRTQFIAQDEEP